MLRLSNDETRYCEGDLVTPDYSQLDPLPLEKRSSVWPTRGVLRFSNSYKFLPLPDLTGGGGDSCTGLRLSLGSEPNAETAKAVSRL